MGARDLLHQTEALNIRVFAEGDRLIVRPATALTPELRQAITEHKPELLAIAPRRYWRVTPPGREPFGVSCPSGATVDEVLAQWPDAAVGPLS